MAKLLAISLALLIVSGCAKPITNWQQSGVSSEKWSDDRSHCNDWSRREAEKANREIAPSQSMSETDNSFRRFMGSYDTQRSQQKLMATCLRRLGYSPSEKTE